MFLNDEIRPKYVILCSSVMSCHHFYSGINRVIFTVYKVNEQRLLLGVWFCVMFGTGSAGGDDQLPCFC